MSRGRHITPTTFFHGNGIAKFFLSTAEIGLSAASILDAPVRCGSQEQQATPDGALWSDDCSRKMQHVPYPLRRSVLEEIEERLHVDMIETASHQFRHPSDFSIPSSMAHYWSYHTAGPCPVGSTTLTSTLRIRWLPSCSSACFGDAGTMSSASTIQSPIQRPFSSRRLCSLIFWPSISHFGRRSSCPNLLRPSGRNAARPNCSPNRSGRRR